MWGGGYLRSLEWSVPLSVKQQRLAELYAKSPLQFTKRIDSADAIKAVS